MKEIDVNSKNCNKYKVYIHCLPNNKVYVGITMNTTKERWQSGRGYKNNPRFYNAIRKYGWDNIKHEIVIDNIDKETACALECALIDYFVSYKREFGYNCTLGGEIYEITEETRCKLSEARKGKPWTQAQRENIPKGLRGCKQKDSIRLAKAIRRRQMLKENRIKINRGSLVCNAEPVRCLNDGIVYGSIAECAQKYHLTRILITKVCMGEREHTKGYKFEYINQEKKNNAINYIRTQKNKIKTKKTVDLTYLENRNIPVLDMLTGIKYKSATEAGKQLNLRSSLIVRSCRNRYMKHGGRKWEFAIKNPPKNLIRRAIVNVTTGERFSTIKEACQKYGLNNPNIVNVCKLKTSHCAGYIWRYEGEEDRIFIHKHDTRKKPIMCITNGIIYKDIKTAAKSLGITSKGISKYIKIGRTYAGLKFKFVEG